MKKCDCQISIGNPCNFCGLPIIIKIKTNQTNEENKKMKNETKGKTDVKSKVEVKPKTDVKVDVKPKAKIENHIDKKVDTKPKTEVKAKVEVKKEPTTNAGLFQKFALVGVKDRKTLATKIFETHKKEGRTECKGKPITVEKIQFQISAMLREIVQKRKGWWSTYEVVETKESLKITEKPQLPK